MRRISLLLFAAIALLLAACSENKTMTEQPTAEPETQPTKEPTPPPAEATGTKAAATGEQAATKQGTEATPEPCGEEGQPHCPLGEWMEHNALAAVEDQNLPGLALAYRQIAVLVPDPAWNEGDHGWAKIALEGAEKADAGNFRAAKTACKSCHDQWQDRYMEQFRHRPINVPPVPPT